MHIYLHAIIRTYVESLNTTKWSKATEAVALVNAMGAIVNQPMSEGNDVVAQQQIHL